MGNISVYQLWTSMDMSDLYTRKVSGVMFNAQNTSITAQFIGHQLISNQYSNEDDDAGNTGVVSQTAKPQLKKPSFYQVVLLNDDYTPMDFVVEVLEQFFALSIEQATQVMLTIHHQGQAVAGIYPKDIAETKAQQVIDFARHNQHPLLCRVEQKPD